MPTSTFFRSFARFALLSLSVFALTPACSSDDDGSGMAIDATVELLDGFELDSGPMPGSGPVQVSLLVSGSAVAKVHLPAVAAEAGGAASLYPSGAGTIEVSGGFTLDGTLKVDQSGVPSYDGDIPGLEDVNLAFSGSAPVEAFAIDAPVSVSAPITPGDLPPIPLPGGIPGHLQLSVAEGSSIEVKLQGTCAGVDGTTAEYQASAVRGGNVNIAIAVDIDVPIVGTQTFDIGTFTVALPESTHEVAGSLENVSLADAPDGSSAAPSCSVTGEGGNGSGGNGSGGDGNGGNGNGGDEGTGGSVGEGGSGGETGTACSSDASCPEGEGCTTNGFCSPLYWACPHFTPQVGDLTLIAGDREFGGNGPNVQVSVIPSASSDGALVVAISVKMEELGGDGSVGEAIKAFSFSDPEASVDTVYSGSFSTSYVDEDADLDVPVTDGGDSVGAVVCQGDTDGQDICAGTGCSYCQIDLLCFQVTLK